ncbi:IGFBP domain-containing protein isoform X2 [Kryptolebias marmoratus]|uniref:IGFBP domain-containing protein isoform X2 n=1 Tax=Kryptolebias marmoratus TaxID=37003 RepID=UPI0007F8FEAF|nr:IGFBP domain-containing protein isoform X2 [Kryptolebias marmoratus]
MWLLLFLCGPLGVLGSKESPGGSGGDPRQLQALHCPPCERIHCSTRRALRLRCKGGLTTDVCGCCPACARADGEACGGTWDYLGKCDGGMVCVHQESDADKPEAERRGVCKAVIEPREPESCQPACTKDYCQAHPAAVCSARSVSLEKKACQGSCQHTSCSSCLVLRPPPCRHACASSDSACLQRFGRVFLRGDWCVWSLNALSRTPAGNS